jgi:hypothetical protein
VSRSQTITSAIIEVNGPSELVVRRAQKALDTSLRALSGAAVRDGAPYRKGPRRCGTECAKEVARSLGVTGVALLELQGTDSKIVFDLSFWVDGEKQPNSRKGDTTAEAFELSLKTALEEVVPGWLRKGFGAMAVQLTEDATLKVDGRVLKAKPGDIVSLPAGAHQVDLMSTDGTAFLRRIEIPESSRVPVEWTAPRQSLSQASSGPSALRYVSYGLFILGAASVASGFIAGALARSTGSGLLSCTGETRSCSTLVEVEQRRAQSQQYASTGNLLFIVGGSVMALAVALFSLDTWVLSP